MKKDQANLKYFIQNKKNIIILTAVLVFILLLISLFFINFYLEKIDKQRERTLSYFYPQISESMKKEKINGENSTKLRNYLLNNGKSEYKTWGQICLFFRFDECINYNATWGLKEEHKKVVEDYYMGKSNELLISNEKESTSEENNCFLLFYKTQKNKTKYKTEFLNNYNTCRVYYIKELPNLVDNEKRFLEIFE